MIFYIKQQREASFFVCWRVSDETGLSNQERGEISPKMFSIADAPHMTELRFGQRSSYKIYAFQNDHYNHYSYAHFLLSCSCYKNVQDCVTSYKTLTAV